MKKPLLTMLWCESVAPFGKPVVPDVYWMLIGSSKSSSASRARRSPPGRASARARRLVPVLAEDDPLAQRRRVDRRPGARG